MQSSIFLCLSQARINWKGCSRKGIRRKNGGTDEGGLLLGADGVAPTRTVGVSASCCHPKHHKVQKKFSSGTSSPGWSQRKGHKMVVVVVVAQIIVGCYWKQL